MKPLALVLPIAASLAFAQQPRGMHYSITATAIANLLRANGTNVTSSQVHLPMELTAAIPEPHLEIVRTRRVTDHELDLEVHCQATSECLPFDALVDVNDANTITAGAHTGGSFDRPSRQAGVEEVIESSSLPVESTASTSDQLRVGAHAVLVIVDGPMRIHLPVIAMDSGSKGTLIRVSTLDRKKIFHALVVDGATVQGTLQ
ncbi:MAG TPA: flagella basal body P-ring formation protein FlgA [Acidobacteriaceae bacterium]|nr:flagella basal body P-ring formation protein FlgA [Acidobacteriaceae bacterium]